MAILCVSSVRVNVLILPESDTLSLSLSLSLPLLHYHLSRLNELKTAAALATQSASKILSTSSEVPKYIFQYICNLDAKYMQNNFKEKNRMGLKEYDIHI